MKKIISLITVLLLSFTLVACSETDYNSKIDELSEKITNLEKNETNIDDLQKKIDELNQKLSQLETENAAKQEEINDLKSRLNELEDKYFDGTITIVIENEDGTAPFKKIRFIVDEEKSFFDLLNDNFKISYQDSAYGKYLTGIENLNPKYGAYIAFYKNNSYAQEGIEAISYNDGDEFKFVIEWYDQVEKAVDTAIKNFISNFASQYVTKDKVDYFVGSSLCHLDIINNYVSKDDMNLKYKDLTSNSGTELFKAIIAITAAGGNPMDVNGNDLIGQLVQAQPIGGWGLTAYGAIALNTYDHGKDVTTYNTAIINDLTTINTPKIAGADIGGTTLIALANYKDNTEVQTVINEFINYISTENQINTGGVTDSWSGENSATISQVILGLTANGIDPRGAQFTKENGDLVTRLLQFGLEDGSFKWKIDDENADLGFSTPQSFAALVSYQQYKNSNSAFSIYDFKK